MCKIGQRLAASILLLFPASSLAQGGYFANWFARVDKTQGGQPHWIVPLATSTARLEEAYHYDELWLENSKGMTTDNYGGSKGFSLIPCELVQVNVNLPPYIVHNNPKIKDGWGDISFAVKYRLLSANEESGNYVLTAFLAVSWPAGQYENGAPHPVITPTIAYGKGLGQFDLQGVAGVGLPAAETSMLGRSIVWNNAFQYRLFQKFWPEVELNSTFFQDGKNNGKKQNLVMLGIVIGRMHLIGRMRLSFGGGYQIATTHFHTNNHNAILTVRFPF
jgi:hypothetical protein